MRRTHAFDAWPGYGAGSERLRAHSSPRRRLADALVPEQLDVSLVDLWDERWSACERFSDVDGATGLLAPWAGQIAILDVIDYGFDFRFASVGQDIVAAVGEDWAGLPLSCLARPLRLDIRRILLKACLVREPVGASLVWALGEGEAARLLACRVRAMPIAGDGLRATRLLMALLPHRLAV